MTQLSNDTSVRAALWLSVFVTAFNVMTVVALLPTIVRDLGTTIGTGQTALVLLALVTAVASSAEEYLSDVYGRRRVYRGGLVLFAIGLIVTFSGATSLALLLGLSVVTGLGAAVLVTAPFVAIADRTDLRPLVLSLELREPRAWAHALAALHVLRFDAVASALPTAPRVCAEEVDHVLRCHRIEEPDLQDGGLRVFDRRMESLVPNEPEVDRVLRPFRLALALNVLDPLLPGRDLEPRRIHEADRDGPWLPRPSGETWLLFLAAHLDESEQRIAGLEEVRVERGVRESLACPA